jgi:glutathione S-transferase
MKLYYHPVSVTSRPVMLFLAEHGIECETKVVDLMVGEHHQEPFTSINPNRLVPVLDDDGFVLTESASILKYLAEKVNSPTWPKDIKARARVNERTDWLNTQFYREYGYHLVYPQVFPHHKRPSDDIQTGTLQWGKERAANALQILNDHIIGNNKYLCGDQITVADYLASSMVTAGDWISVDLSKYPNVQRWLNSMRSLPSWNKVSEIHNGFAASLKDKQFISV